MTRIYPGVIPRAKPAGSDTEIQFNDSDAFGADADLTWDKTNNILTVKGMIQTLKLKKKIEVLG